MGGKKIVTEERLVQFGNELKQYMKDLLSGKMINKENTHRKQSKAIENIQCFGCKEWGHYKFTCTNIPADSSTKSGSDFVNKNKQENSGN